MEVNFCIRAPTGDLDKILVAKYLANVSNVSVLRMPCFEHNVHISKKIEVKRYNQNVESGVHLAS